MPKKLTEDAVRDAARDILGLVDSDVARSGVGQLLLRQLNNCKFSQY